MASGGSGLRTDPQRKEGKMGGHWAQGGGKEVDGWRQGGARTADGSAEKRAKMRGVATQWAPEGGEWRIRDAPGVRGKPGGHRASGRGRDSLDAHFFFANGANDCSGSTGIPTS